MLTANIVQFAYRFRNDDGSETTATWKAALNTPISQADNTTFRLRIAMQETAGGSTNNVDYPLQYRVNGGAWTNPTTATPVRYVTSANVADATPTTQQITGPGNYSTDPSEVDSDGVINNPPSFQANTYVEYEVVLQIVGLNNGDTVEFQKVGLNGFNVTPSLTVSVAIVRAGTVDAQFAAFQADLTGTRVIPPRNGTLDAQLAAFQADLVGSHTPTVVNRDGTLAAEFAAFEMDLVGDADLRAVYLNTTQTLASAVRQTWTGWTDTAITWDVVPAALPLDTALEHAVVLRDGTVLWSPVQVTLIAAQGPTIVFMGGGA